MSTSQSHIRVRAADDAAATEIKGDASPSLSMSAYLADSAATMVVVGTAIAGMFLANVIATFGVSDDYAILGMATGLGPSPFFGKNVLDASAVNGRPFSGLLADFLFSTAGTIDNLRFIRALKIVGIVALALLLHWALVRAGIKRAPAALIVVLMCSLPAFQVFSSWAVLVVAPCAALLGAGASLLTVAATGAPRTVAVDRLVGATAMLVAALLFYQPPAMFFWVFLAVALLGASHDSGLAGRLVRAHLGVGAVALALAYVVVKLGVHAVGKTAPNAGRNALTQDVGAKIHWFFQWPLYRSLNLFDLTPSLWFASLVAAIAAGGMLFLFRRETDRPLLYALFAVCLIPLSFTPSLVVAENSPTYRTEIGISSLIALYLGLGAIGLWLTARDWLRPRVGSRTLVLAKRFAITISMAFVATSAFFAAKNVLTLYVEPQSTELRLVRSQVAAVPSGASHVAFVELSRDQGMTGFVTTDEYGLPSSQAPWTPEPLVLLILREEGRLTRNDPRPVIDVLPPQTTKLPANEPVVDIRGLQQLR
jgi:hypothetical protein